MALTFSTERILPTTGAPGAGLGNPGDYAVDSAASVWYGPKDATTGWPAGVSFKGADGAPGSLNNPMTTSGDIIYGGASGVPTRRAKGTDGQVLTLASGLPAWATPAGGSGSSPRVISPLDQGLLGWSYEPAMSANQFAPSAGVTYLCRVMVPENITITSVVTEVTQQPSTPIANVFVGVYNSAGTLLGKSADLSATWNAPSGVKTAALTAEAGQSLSITGGAGVFVWAAVLVGTQGTTQLWFARTGASAAAANANLSAAQSRFGSIGSGASALPSSITPASLTKVQAIWMALV